MANGGMFVLGNFYVSFCQGFQKQRGQGRLRDHEGRGHPRSAWVRGNIQLIGNT